MRSDIPEPYYIAFINEAGDPGLKSVRPIDPAGGAEWLCQGAVVMKASNSPKVVNWVRSMLADAGARTRSDLHYHNLPDFRKSLICSAVAKLPIRAFVMASNEKNMRQYRNARAERIPFTAVVLQLLPTLAFGTAHSFLF